MNVLSKGVVAVYCAEAVDLTSAVRVFHTDHHSTLSGAALAVSVRPLSKQDRCLGWCPLGV